MHHTPSMTQSHSILVLSTENQKKKAATDENSDHWGKHERAPTSGVAGRNVRMYHMWCRKSVAALIFTYSCVITLIQQKWFTIISPQQ